MNDRTEETKELLRHALTHREASPENDQLQNLFGSLCSDLASCAAGPWRYDVENAEFVDQQEYWLEYTHPWYATEPDANYRGALEYDADGDHFMHPCHGIISRGRIVAFAIPNPPEVKL